MLEKQPTRPQIPLTFSPSDPKQMDLFNVLNDFCEQEGMNRNQLIRNAIKKELVARGVMQA